MSLREAIENGTYQNYFTNNIDKKKKTLRESIEDGTYQNYYSDNDIMEFSNSTDGFFKKSEGNMFETILGTTGDIGTHAVKGIMGIGEGIGDLITYGRAGIEETMGNKEKATSLRQNAQESAMDYIFKDVEKTVDKNSVIGDKGDSIVEGLGYVAGMTAISIASGGAATALGASAGTTGLAATAASTAVTFSSSMGNSMSEAYHNGANDEEAFKYGMIGGLAEAGTELLFGGLGKASKAVGLAKSAVPIDDVLAKKVSGMFKNRLTKNLSQYVIKAGAEGTEELISGVISAIGKKATYMKNEEFGTIIKDEHLLEQFVDGMIISGITQAPSLIKTTSKNRDFSTGYTDNENKVYESIVNNKVNNEVKNIALEEAYNNKVLEQEKMLARDLTDAEKIQVKKEIEESFENGEISTDDIKLKDKKRTEIEEQVKEDLQKGNIETDEIRKIIGENTDISGDTLLQNSYIQAQRKNQSYAYEKTESVAKNAVMESATKATMNNTELSRNLINYVANISEDTGVAYRFANTEQLKELGYSKENKVINGVVSKDGTVYINPQSKEAINYVLGHETTHLLENTEEYSSLQNMVIEYAKQKGVYENTLNDIKETYKDILETSEEFTNELTSELTSRLLFTDENFVSELSVKEPNIFTKIYNYIKHMIKMATAGSEEAKQLEKIKYSFDKAYKSINKNTRNLTENKFSIQEDNNGNKYVKVDTDQDIFEGKSIKEQTKIAQKYILNNFRENGLLKDDNTINVSRKTATEYTHPKNGLDNTTYSSKMKASTELDNLLEISQFIKSEPDDGRHVFAKDGWDYYETVFKVGDKTYSGWLNIANGENGKLLYDITNIKERASNYSVKTVSIANSSINNSITPQNENVNTTKYSIQNNENNANVFDEIIPEGNNYKVTAEDVAIEESNNSENIDIPIVENETEETRLRTKAVQYANRVKDRFIRKFAQDMKIDENLNKQLILDTLSQVEQEINENGKLSQERANEIFDYMYSNLLAEEGKYYTDTVNEDFEILDRENFDRNLEPLIKDLKLADRYNKEELKNTTSIKDVATLKETYKQLSIQQKMYDKVMNKELLTQRDKAQVDRLINQEITVKELPSDVNKQGIINVYNAKKELVELKREVQNYRKNVVSKNRDLAKDMTKNITTWKDKASGWKYQINTMKRNLRDIIPNKAEAQTMYDTYFKPITKNNAIIEKEINNYNERIGQYKINNEESTYIQMIGENKYNPDSKLSNEMITEFYNKNKKKIDIEKCNQAVEEFRKIYDELIEKINTAYLENGYKPIEYRQGYFPHFIEDKAETIIGKMAEKIGWKIKKDTLPTDIAGITDTFKPGKAWTSFSQQRTGDATDYNALKGFDNYIRGAMDVIYHTEDIQKLRALENEIRYQYSDEGIKEKIDEVYSNNELDTGEKEIQIGNLLDNIKNSPMGNLVTELKNYTNNLANKKATGDRGMEEFWSRETYSIMSNIQNRVSANMVGANISSALTNFIPITQAWSQTSTKNLMRGMQEAIATCYKDDGFADNSTFLTNRTKSADRLYKTGLENINDKLGFMFEKVDEFTSNTIVRAKYYDNIEQGMSVQEAMDNADEFAKDVMAGRSKGDMPTVFNKKNPVAKLFTAFQLEVNNQYGYMLKDIPTDLGGEAKKKLIGAFVKMFLGAFFYNMLAEKITGRKSAFSPIDITLDTYKTATNENLGTGEKITNIASDLVGELPFVGGVAGGGRLPIQAAIPDVSNTITSIADLFDMNVEDKSTAIKTLQQEVSKPLYYVALPFAGGQLKKTIEGLSMYNDDLPIAGSYTNSGKLRYTVSEDLGTKIKAGIFGQYSVKEAQEYFERGYSPLTEKQTQELVGLNISMSDYREYKSKLKEIDNIKADDIEDDTSKLEMKLDYINSLDITDAQKNILANNATTRKEPIDMSKYGEYSGLEEMDYAIKNPAAYKVINTITDFNTYNNYKEEIENIKEKYSTSTQKKRAVVDYINELPLDVGAKAVMIKLNYNSIDDNNPIIVNYINNLDLNYNDKIAIFEKLGFTYKEGRIYD